MCGQMQLKLKSRAVWDQGWMELKSDAAAQFRVSPSSGSKVVITSCPIGHRPLTPDCVSMVDYREEIANL